jgi:hypothetical protein
LTPAGKSAETKPDSISALAQTTDPAKQLLPL